MTILIGGVLVNQCGVWERRKWRWSALVFWITRLAPPDVKKTASPASAECTRYCISAAVEAVYFNADEGTEWSDKGSWLLV